MVGETFWQGREVGVQWARVSAGGVPCGGRA